MSKHTRKMSVHSLSFTACCKNPEDIIPEGADEYDDVRRERDCLLRLISFGQLEAFYKGESSSLNNFIVSLENAKSEIKNILVHETGMNRFLQNVFTYMDINTYEGHINSEDPFEIYGFLRREGVIKDVMAESG